MNPNPNLAKIVRIIHIIVVILILYIPFTKNEKYLDFYIIVVPFLFFHWAVNDDTCVLTVIERRLRNADKKEDTFLHQIISPIYKLPNHQLGILSKTIVLCLYYYVLLKTKKVKIY